MDTTEGSQLAYSHSSSLVRKRSRTSFLLPGEWQVRSDSPYCRSLGNGQATALLQSNILLETCRYLDKIFAYYCHAVPVPFQRLFKSFFAALGIKTGRTQFIAASFPWAGSAEHTLAGSDVRQVSHSSFAEKRQQPKR